MPGGTRRMSRSRGVPISPPVISSFANEPCGQRYTSLGLSPPATPTVEQPLPPKHFPFPNTPVDSDLFFEFLMCFFAVSSAGFQYLHLYRSVWWLPHSYTSLAMNFYLIDENLVIFILVILSRRLIYVLGCKLLDKTVSPSVTGQKHDFTYFRSLLFALICVMLSICACFVIQNQPKVNILYLCYPILVYLILFGFHVRPFFELVSWCSDCKPPLHACSSSAMEIRREVENLRANFNDRMKQMLFSSIVNAYYAGFIPCCFAQPALHYDIFWATQHFFFIFFSSFMFSQTHILSLRYCDVLHRSALHLGIWEKLEIGRTLIMVNNDWHEDYLWPSGVLVKHDKQIWRAQGDCNSSRPGDKGLAKFYKTFILPSFPLSILSGLHILMVFYQLFLLVRSALWFKILSITFVLFFNYYVLYKVCRDYLVSYKIYREERDMHQKIDYR